MSTANLIAAMLLTAFVIERAVSAGTFVTSLLWPQGLWNASTRRDLYRTFCRTAVAGALAAAVIGQFDWMRLLHTFGVKGQPEADALLTWLVLLSGTDRLSAFIGAGADRAMSSKGNEAALDLRGTVTVDGASARAVSDRAPR